MFTTLRRNHLDNSIQQRLDSQYQTVVTFISEYRLQCETPSQLHDGETLMSQGDELEITILLNTNLQEYRPFREH